MATVTELEEQLAAPPVRVEQLEADLAAPKRSLLTPRLTMDDLIGPSGQMALAAGLAMTPIAGPRGFLAGVGGSLLAEEGTRRLQEQFGPNLGLGIGMGLSTLMGGISGLKGAIPLRRPPVLATEQGGMTPLRIPELATERGGLPPPSVAPITKELGALSDVPPPAPPIVFTLKPEGELFTKNLAPAVHQKMAGAAKAYFGEHPESFVPEMTVADNMVREYLRGNLTAPFLQEYGIATQDFLPQFRESIRQSAQRMSYHSQVMRTIDLNSEEADALRKAGFAVDDATILRPLWKRLDDMRRGLLVTQLSTAVRNAETQIGRVGLDVLQAPLDAGIQKMAGVPRTVSPLDGLEEMLSIFRKGTKGNVEKILDRFPAQKDRLLMTYSSDLQRPTGLEGGMKYAEQAVDVLNWANRFQEYQIRRGVFQAKLSQELRGRGLDLNQIIQSNAVNTIPTEAIDAAVKQSLNVTFAETPKPGTAARAFVDVVNKLPGATLPIPFPRFMVNSLKFIWDYNPTGILNYLSESERKAFAAGDVSAISKATLGTGMLLTAYQLRNSEYAGEKWYEVKGPEGTTIDLRPFNPFAAHLFLADVAKRAHDGTLDSFTAKDIAMGVLSTNMRAGVGLYTLDKALEGVTSYGDSEGALRGIKELAGQTVGGVLTPLRQVIDLLGEFDRAHRTLRDVTQEPFAGPVKANIPGVVTTLPEAAVPTRTGPPERVHPLARQLTGLALSQKTPVETELDRLGFTRHQILPSTGDPAIDRVRALTMGPTMERGIGRLVLSPHYLDLTDHEKAFVMESVVGQLRNPANVAGIVAMDPKQLIQSRLKSMPARKRRVIEDKMVQ